jgi:hypothetical protein
MSGMLEGISVVEVAQGLGRDCCIEPLPRSQRHPREDNHCVEQHEIRLIGLFSSSSRDPAGRAEPTLVTNATDPVDQGEDHDARRGRPAASRPGRRRFSPGRPDVAWAGDIM